MREEGGSEGGGREGRGEGVRKGIIVIFLIILD